MDNASDGVMTCGNAAIGREITVGAEAPRSWKYFINSCHSHITLMFIANYLLQEIGGQHEHFRIWSKALHSTKIANALLVILGR